MLLTWCQMSFFFCVFPAVQGSRRSDEEALEEQGRKMGEELREIRDLYDAERDKTMCVEEELLRLHNQVRCRYSALSESVSQGQSSTDRIRCVALSCVCVLVNIWSYLSLSKLYIIVRESHFSVRKVFLGPSCIRRWVWVCIIPRVDAVSSQPYLSNL